MEKEGRDGDKGLCRQACPSIRMLDGLIAQKAEAVP